MLTRRSLTQSVLVMAGFAGWPATFSKSEEAMPDFSHKNERMSALAKLRGSLKDEIVTWWLKGVLYGVVDGVPTKLWNMETVSFNRWRKISEGEFIFAHYELSLKIDLETEQLLRSFNNPYTGEMIDVGYDTLGPSNLIVTADSARFSTDTGPISPKLRHEVDAPVIQGNDIWVGQDLYAIVPAPRPDLKPWKAHDISTYAGKLSDVVDPAVLSAPATIGYQGIYDWRPWMNMGDVAGFHMSRLVGRKLGSISNIPNSFADIANEVKPDFIAGAEKAMHLP